jgi:hypothetical protein
MDYILIDNFFENVDDVRSIALSSNYTKSNEETGWKGFRAPIIDVDIISTINNKLIEFDSKFKDIILQHFFHYTLDNTKNEQVDFLKERFHKDGFDWAGVVYLTPNPPPNSGTIIFDRFKNPTIKIENIYNRFVFYNGNTLHGVEDTFGNNIIDGRMTVTLFGMLDNTKKIKTLI